MKFLHIILVFILLFTAQGHCQFASVSFVSETPFYISVDGITQNSKEINELKLENMREGTYFFSITIDDIDSVLSFNYKIENFFYYELVIVTMPNHNEAAENMQFMIASNAKIMVYCKAVNKTEKPKDFFDSTVNTDLSNPNYQHSHQAYNNTDDSLQINNPDSLQMVSPHNNYSTNIQSTYSQMDYTGPKGCICPMDEKTFVNTVNIIKSKDFEDTKLKIAKQISSSNCLLVEQVMIIMKLFDFEDNRLDFAKFAYKYVFDRGNYFKINELFDFESSTDELINFINTCNNE
ncbi:MAG: DUF4476 domain-containing protein [Bacteroidales bacterium]|nr:DUF4476 domain-containing protein [Bacteroidales bacterium]